MINALERKGLLTGKEVLDEMELIVAISVSLKKTPSLPAPGQSHE